MKIGIPNLNLNLKWIRIYNYSYNWNLLFSEYLYMKMCCANFANVLFLFFRKLLHLKEPLKNNLSILLDREKEKGIRWKGRWTEVVERGDERSPNKHTDNNTRNVRCNDLVTAVMGTRAEYQGGIWFAGIGQILFGKFQGVVCSEGSFKL